MNIDKINDTSKCTKCNMLYINVNDNFKCEYSKGYRMLATRKKCKWFDTPKLKINK